MSHTKSPPALTALTVHNDVRRLLDAFEPRLAASLPACAGPEDLLVLAMREGVLAPGKRLRPLLLLVVGEGLGVPCERLMGAACALEMVHAASLFLDDLPCMDDAAERRGRPTLHCRFGEDTAVLAAVSVLALAFKQVAASALLPAAARLRMVEVMADAVGTEGLARGQLADLRASAVSTAGELMRINRQKTGSLFSVAFEIAALAADAPQWRKSCLARCAFELGQAFQLQDDLADAGSGLEDAVNGRSTLVSAAGRAQVLAELAACVARAQRFASRALPDAPLLNQLVRASCITPQATDDASPLAAAPLRAQELALFSR